MRTLHILTACSRPDGLLRSAARILAESFKEHWFLIRWHIAFQNHAQPDPHGAVKDSELMDLIPGDDWIWILDDDNEIHPAFFVALWKAWSDFPEKEAIVFSQNRKDGLGPVLLSGPENMRKGRVDTAQVVFKKSLIGPKRMITHPMCDGIFYEDLYQSSPAAFTFVPDPVVNFNWQKD
jgi:hypothetical protein